MVFQVIWSDRSRHELAQITNTIRADNPIAAERFVDDLVRRIDQLGRSPRAAAVYSRRPGFEFRQFSYRRYRVFYRVRPRLKRIEITSIWHGARQDPKLP